MAQAGAHDHPPQHDHHHGEDEDYADSLDLDAQVLAGHLAAITGWLHVGSPPRRILDLGCGTGAGTLALLDRFPDAHVTAVDASAAHLRRLRENASARGVARRVRTLQADLDEPTWPDLGTPGLVWASASMHHMTDPGRALRAVHDLMAPDGLFVLVEQAGFPRFLPDGEPQDRPGVEDRAHGASDRHARVPHRGADWGPMLTAAGFTIEAEQTHNLVIEGSGNEAVGAYAVASLRRLRDGVADSLAAEDLTALDRLLDSDGPHSILGRDDLALRTTRSVWAVRPR